MNKKTAIRSVILLTLLIGAITFGWFRFFYVPDYPEGVLSDRETYAIDPQTILASLNRGETDVFLPAPPEPDGAWPILWPSGSFVWDQEDYMTVADALHQVVWKESLDDWQLIRARYTINQCQVIFGRIDSAELSFYQRREDYNDVHGFWINPLYGIVNAGSEYSYLSGYIAKWQGIDLNSVKIKNVDAALQVAEENGGKEARSSVKNECTITLLLSPDRLKYDFLSHPFTRYGWGWSVIYWPNESNADPIFEMIIDPYTGMYEILDQNE